MLAVKTTGDGVAPVKAARAASRWIAPPETGMRTGPAIAPAGAAIGARVRAFTILRPIAGHHAPYRFLSCFSTISWNRRANRSSAFAFCSSTLRANTM